MYACVLGQIHTNLVESVLICMCVLGQTHPYKMGSVLICMRVLGPVQPSSVVSVLISMCVLGQTHPDSVPGMSGVAAESAVDYASAKAAFKSAYAHPETRKVVGTVAEILKGIKTYGEWYKAICSDLEKIKKRAAYKDRDLLHFVDKDTGCVYRCYGSAGQWAPLGLLRPHPQLRVVDRYIAGTNTRLLKKIVVQPLTEALKSMESDFTSALHAFIQTGTFGINMGALGRVLVCCTHHGSMCMPVSTRRTNPSYTRSDVKFRTILARVHTRSRWHWGHCTRI